MSEPQRLALHAAARKALGEKEGDTLMALSPPANTDIATMQALEQLEKRFDAKLDAFFGVVDTKLEHAQALTDARIAQAESRMETQMWRVVVGTGVGLYLAIVGTMAAAYQLIS